MKKLLNTLYVTSENSYLGLDGENIVVFEEDKEKGRLPLLLPWSVWGWILMWDIFIPKDQVEYHWLWI